MDTEERLKEIIRRLLGDLEELQKERVKLMSYLSTQNAIINAMDSAIKTLRKETVN